MDGNLYLKDMTGAAIGTAANPLVVYATGSTGVSSLSALTDVLIVSPASGQSILYSATDSKWHNGSISGSGDMMKSAYATVSENTVDNSYGLNGHADTYFATALHDHNIWALTGYATLDAYSLGGVVATGYATSAHTHAHNDTTGKQGGTTDEYYHLTSAQTASVAAWDVATASHLHTGTYLPIAGKAADSELLDGVDSTGYSTAAHTHNIWTLTGYSTINADTLDGNEASAFAAASHAHAQYELNTIPSEILTTTAPGWFRILHSATANFDEPLELMVRVRSSDYKYFALYKFLIFSQNHQDNSDAAQIILLGGFRNNEAGYTGFTDIRVRTNTTGSGTAYVDINLYENLYVTTYILSRNTAQWVAYDYINEIASNPPEVGVTTVSLNIQNDGLAVSGKIYSRGTQVALTSATHNSWSSPQGGAANQYYHLDATSYASVTAWNVAAAASRLTAVSTSFSFPTTSNDDGLIQQTVDLGANFGQIVRVRVWADQTMGQRTAGTVLINNASGIDPSTTSMAYDGLVGTLPTAGAEGVGDYVWIDNELCRVSAGTSTPLTIVRGLCGSMGAFHDDNAVVTTANDGLRIALFQTATSYPAEAILDMRKVMTGKFTTDAAITAGDKVFTLSSSPAVLADWGYDDLGLIDDTSDEYFRVQKTYGAVSGTTYDDSIAVLNPLAAHDTSKTVYRVVEYTTPIPFKFSGSATTLYLDIYANQLLPGATTVYFEFLVDKWS